ncbi:MAG: helix-turn-helix domain-containing protein [Gammaproteobacteria bacterium]|nr:helix-turn-helix domain-containing protein [Gammaproteobacteria bacterium]
MSRPGEFPKLEVIADELSMGTRTLRRRLRSLGTGYQQILDDVKKELAIEYLQTTNLSIQEISELLDYSEVDEFSPRLREVGGRLALQVPKTTRTKGVLGSL